MGLDGEQHRLSQGYKQSSDGVPRREEVALTLDSSG